MLHRDRELGLAKSWFTGDEVCGTLELRRTAHTLGFDCALAVKADHRATAAVGRRAATQPAAKVSARTWMCLRMGHGTKSDRYYDRALIDVLPRDTPPGRGARTTGGPSSFWAFGVRRNRSVCSLPLSSASPTPAPAPPTEPGASWNAPRPLASCSWPS
ncbi:hypothetical protein AB0G76_36425 [Streptomyces asoensis]|uniref:hypothetical protein n=1 Tax=Streptomyces asoensis TaxID=249586 RepID=UPI0033FBE886